jgi:SAM-dependent methyltransferase/uncharacterized protein YbaR (Trm112 family)
MRLLSLLACPRDRSDLRLESDHLLCAHGHKYHVVSGIPILLLAECEQTIGIAAASLKASESTAGSPLYVDTLGLSDDEKLRIGLDWKANPQIDPVISYLVGATSGHAYASLVGRLESYPFPEIPIEASHGELLLDVGSNWGRWSVSAARKGWRVIGIDPSLGALLAAQRAFSDMPLDIAWVCGDARFLPFKAGLFACTFSYSVIQHFSETDAELSIAEIGRVLRRGGVAKIQMAHAGGVRSQYSRHRDRMNDGPFRVRYWPLTAMRNVFEKRIGPTECKAEAFGGLGLLTEDRKHLSLLARSLVTISAILKKLSEYVKPLINIADSVYVISVKR